MNKVDRALEMAVIDWLQWNEFQPSDKNLPALALELIEKRRQHCKEIEAQADKLVEALKAVSAKKTMTVYNHSEEFMDGANTAFGQAAEMADDALADWEAWKGKE